MAPSVICFLSSFFPYWILKFVFNELLLARKYKSLVDFSWEVLLIKSLSREAEGCQVEKLICLDITVVCSNHGRFLVSGPNERTGTDRTGPINGPVPSQNERTGQRNGTVRGQNERTELKRNGHRTVQL